ncbi:hypothetical protein KDK_33210 [Dictyobacter kobayashii]|uniref:Uncharacterized protein n=2 Tax=Dictyobacter kobayashii TaxID=2014872 RepID=A0A402AK71_9CHLR|nr:hypothetical protein KDK_33210 [Dictyobacter kobayashii]
MDCLCLVAPKDEELLRYTLDGEALPTAAKEHLVDCIICQQRLNSYTYANNFLLSQLYRCQCPDMTVLSHYCIGLLSAHEEDEIRAHVESCPVCATDIAEMRSFLGSPAPVMSSDLPLPFSVDTQPVSVDFSSCQPPIALQPQTSHVRVWPYLHQTDNALLSLYVKRDYESGITFYGSLLPKSDEDDPAIFADMKIELYYAMSASDVEDNPNDYSIYAEQRPSDYMQQPVFSTLVDGQGMFIFKAIPAGKYLMIVYLPETALVIEKLRIEEN